MTDETTCFNGSTLHRIRALKDFGDVKKGDLGGWILGWKNLSQKGNCWIYDNAVVTGDAYLIEDAKAYGYASVRGHARVSGKGLVCGYAIVEGYAHIAGQAIVAGNAHVTGDAGNAVKIAQKAIVYGYAKVLGSASIFGEARIYGDATVSGRASIQGNAKIHGKAVVIAGQIDSDSDISSIGDAIFINPFGTRGLGITFSKSPNGINVVSWNFSGKIEDFEEFVMNEMIRGEYKQGDLDAIAFVKKALSNPNTKITKITKTAKITM